MSEERRQRLRGAAIVFGIIFCANAFVLSISFFLFFNFLSIDAEGIRRAAPITFVNVLVLTGLFMAVYLLYNYYTVTLPVRRIRVALERITQGDFTVRIPTEGNHAIFDEIVESINAMTQELESVETLKTDFVSHVSHELKTPIAVLQNYATLLQSETLSETERREYTQAIYESTARLGDLVSNILRLNRLKNQQIHPKAIPFDLTAQLTECLLGFEQIWEEKDIQIEPALEEEVWLRSDRELLSILWNNLLSNAFKFTDPGGTVGVSVVREGDEAVVAVWDTGCGISEAAGRHIFEQFYQADTSHATAGNGLGLALVRRILDITGARIDVQSTVGEGSTFTVRFPGAYST